MADRGHTIETRSGVTWAILQGELEREDAINFVTELKEHVTAQATQRVVFDLRQLADCSIFARSELVRGQRWLKERSARTAYLASSSRFRGLGLWVAHLSEDENVKAVVSEIQAEEWLTGSEGREALTRKDLVR